MDRQRGRSWTEVRALIRRASGHYLIVKPHADAQAPWEFPSCRVPPRTSAEEVLLRACQERLGLEIEPWVNQLPQTGHFGTFNVAYQYVLCRALSDEAAPIGYAELRWVLPAQLRDYHFDTPDQEIVERILVPPE